MRIILFYIWFWYAVHSYQLARYISGIKPRNWRLKNWFFKFEDKAQFLSKVVFMLLSRLDCFNFLHWPCAVLCMTLHFRANWICIVFLFELLVVLLCNIICKKLKQKVATAYDACSEEWKTISLSFTTPNAALDLQSETNPHTRSS